MCQEEAYLMDIAVSLPGSSQTWVIVLLSDSTMGSHPGWPLTLDIIRAGLHLPVFLL